MGKYILPAHYKILRKALLITLFIIPVIVLIGWITNLPFLSTLAPGPQVPMNPLTAVFFMIISTAGYLSHKSQGIDPIKLPLKIALYAIGIGLVLFCSFIVLRDVYSWPLYPDAVLLHDVVRNHLMSLNTALCFGLCGVTLISLLAAKPLCFALMRVSSISVLAIAIAAVVGYLLDQPTFYSFGIFTPMALWSAILFVLIGVSMLRLNREDAELSKWLLASVVIILSLLISGGSKTIYNFESQNQIQQNLEYAEVIAENSNDIAIAAFSAENSLQKYLLSGNQAVLAPYFAAQAQSRTALDSLAKATSKVQANSITLLRELIRQRDAEYDNILKTVADRSLTAGIELFRAGNDRTITDRIVESTEQITNNNTQSIASILQSQRTANDQTILSVRFSATVVSIMLLSSLVLLMREAIAKKAAENLLLEERNKALAGKTKNDAILRSIGDGVFALDSKNHIILFNRAAEQITGLSANDVLGKRCHDVLHFIAKNSSEKVTKFIDQAQCGQITKMAQSALLMNAHGELIPVADSAAPIKDQHGRHLGIIVVFRDVTKQRQLEKAKDEFISLASHQLRTPLASMRILSEVLLSNQFGKLNKRQSEYLKMIEESTLRMIVLVGDMLNISRIELGRLTIKPQPTDLRKLITAQCDTSMPLIRKKRLELITQLDKDLPLYNVDPVLFDQIIHNLLSNAIRYTPTGGKITIQCNHDSKGFRLTIKDTGIGIPEKAKEHIFERFFRADNAIITIGEGTGLGLYFVKLILDSSGGKIRFQSQEGQGTIFTVEIPPKGMESRNSSKRREKL